MKGKMKAMSAAADVGIRNQTIFIFKLVIYLDFRIVLSEFLCDRSP